MEKLIQKTSVSQQVVDYILGCIDRGSGSLPSRWASPGCLCGRLSAPCAPSAF